MCLSISFLLLLNIWGVWWKTRVFIYLVEMAVHSRYRIGQKTLPFKVF